MFPEDRFVEILIIGALALIVIGPKDLPVLMRKIGQFIGRMRGMAAEFRASFDEMARQSELDDLRREVDALRHTQQTVANPLNEPHVRSAFEEINKGVSIQFPPPASPRVDAVAPSPETPASQTPAPAAQAPEPPPAPSTPEPASAEAEPPSKPKPVRKPRAKVAKATGEAS